MMVFIDALIGLSFWSWIGALIGISAVQSRGYHPLFGLVAGVGLGPLAVLIYITSQGAQCPHCREWVRRDASKCKHCHSVLEPMKTARAKRNSEEQSSRVSNQRLYSSLQDNDIWRCGAPGCGRQLGGPKGECPQCGAMNYRA